MRAIATDSVSQAVFFNPQGLTARGAAQAAVAIRWPRPIGILETRGPKPSAVARVLMAWLSAQSPDGASISALPPSQSCLWYGAVADLCRTSQWTEFLARGSSHAPNLCVVGCLFVRHPAL